MKLTDFNDTPISNQTINVTIIDKDNATSYYSVVSNENGVGKLKLDKSEGKYEIKCTYYGNENFNGNSSSKSIKIEKEVIEAQTESSSSSSSSQSSSDDYVYSPQSQSYIKKSGQWSSDEQGNDIYTYHGDDGVIYERYYDSNGNEIDPNDYYN